jgi:hypothetical protein
VVGENKSFPTPTLIKKTFTNPQKNSLLDKNKTIFRNVGNSEWEI